MRLTDWDIKTARLRIDVSNIYTTFVVEEDCVSMAMRVDAHVRFLVLRGK